jgi:acyl-coenzyme A synthetase/AMP-(fatty) acid ligase
MKKWKVTKKIRGGVFIVKDLPRGKTGKVVRSMVAAMPLGISSN